MSGGITAAGVATGLATSIGGAVVSSAVGSLMGGGSSSGGGGGQSGGGGLNVAQTQFANSIKLNEGPKFGGSREPAPTNPDVKATSGAPEHAASKWNINSTPTAAVGEEQAKQDSQNMWADRLSRFIDFSTRQLG